VSATGGPASAAAPASSSAATVSGPPLLQQTSALPPTTAAVTTVPRTTVPLTSAPRITTTAAAHTGPAVEVMSGPTSAPVLALTFHGAGELTLARSILQIVKDKQVKITVMAIGSWLDANPQMAEEILRGGHEIGNHTYNHLDINSLPSHQITAEIGRCAEVLARLTGSAGTYFRQSQSQHASEQVKALAGAAGYPTCLSYNLDSMDYTDPGGPAVRRYMKAASSGAIVSMHLGHQSTVDALPGVLDDLAARGLRPVTVGTLLHA